MRLLVNLLILLMLASIAGGALWHYREQDTQALDLRTMHNALAKLQEQMYFHEALVDGSSDRTHYPRQISPLWFPDGPPPNTLTPGCQWLDIAPADDQSDEPPDPIVHRPEQGGFWYNPNRGIFRARVLPQATMSATVDLYNSVNGTALKELIEIKPKTPPTLQTAQVDQPDPSAADLDNPAEAAPPAKPKLPTLRDQDH